MLLASIIRQLSLNLILVRTKLNTRNDVPTLDNKNTIALPLGVILTPLDLLSGIFVLLFLAVCYNLQVILIVLSC